jgi:DNA-binding FrmR family transcriptional regulator
MAGCGGGIQTESVTPPRVTPKEAIKSALDQVVQSGQVGSEIGAVMQQIEALKATDAAMATALEDDARSLMSLGSGEAAKTKAKQMLSKLQGGG